MHRPAETVKYCEFGARGGGGPRGGGGARGGSGGARGEGGVLGGGGGFEHTRQPVETDEKSESHLIDLLPNVKAEGPKDNPSPLKGTSVPAVLGKLSLSAVCVEKAVAVMLLPMASEVGVMEHVWLMA